MGFHINILKVKSRNKIVEIAEKTWKPQFLPQLKKILRIFRLYNVFEKFMIVEILTSEDEHFRNASCNNIEKLCQHIINVISKPFFLFSSD